MDEFIPARDICPQERMDLTALRHRPQIYLGEKSLRNFYHLCIGYRWGMERAGLVDTHVLLPDGLNEYVNRRYGGGNGTRNWYSIISLWVPDEGEALDVFFELLDEYLLELGYAPLKG